MSRLTGSSSSEKLRDEGVKPCRQQSAQRFKWRHESSADSYQEDAQCYRCYTPSANAAHITTSHSSEDPTLERLSATNVEEDVRPKESPPYSSLSSLSHSDKSPPQRTSWLPPLSRFFPSRHTSLDDAPRKLSMRTFIEHDYPHNDASAEESPRPDQATPQIPTTCQNPPLSFVSGETPIE